MKIKTITSHDVYNYGASLQAYALMAYLQQQGYETEIIDYKPEYVLRKYNYMWVNPESGMHKYRITRVIYRILKFIQRQTTMRRKRAFDDFTRRFLRVTSLTYASNADLMHCCPQADAYIVGSDQVWNTFYDAGKDPAFYLDFVPAGCRRISYAASFSVKDIVPGYREFVRKHLALFDAISVREHHGVEILKRLDLKGEWVLDPVFLLPVSEWERIILPSEKKEKYILIYDFEQNTAIKEFALLLAQRHAMKIYSITDNYPLRYADKNYNAAGPLEFITLLYHAEYFISNSFHGSAFSILFQKDFYVFPRHRHPVNSRMESLLEMFGVGEQLISDRSQFEASVDRHIDYERVQPILAAKIVSSKDYLHHALHS